MSGKPTTTVTSWYAERLMWLPLKCKKFVYIENLMKLEILPRSVTHPTITYGELKVTVSAQLVEASKDFPNGGLVFEFGPSGLQFSPSAILHLDWSQLGDLLPSESLSLKYYDEENKKWIIASTLDDSNPDYVWSVNKRSVKFYIPHFSIWAIDKNS